MEHVQKRRRPRRKNRTVGALKNALLLCLCLVTLAVPILSGTGGTAFAEPVNAQAAAYDDVAIDMAGATAFEDARKTAGKEGGDTQTQFTENISALTGGNHWGNVGLLVGPKSTGQTSENWSTLRSPVSINKEQIDSYNGSSNSFTKYKTFGGAVQKMNERAKKEGSSAYSLQEGLDQMTAVGASLGNLGITLLQQYNPAPLLGALVDNGVLVGSSRYSWTAGLAADAGSNELVQFVNAPGNENIKGFFDVMGGTVAFGLPLTFLIMAFLIFILLITSVLLTLFNGRSAGENVRKALVKLVVGCVAVPLVVTMLNSGIGFLADMSATTTTAPQDNYVRQNLNFADWQATGFAMPSGTSITINEDGEFVMEQEDVEAINKFTYKQIMGVDNPSSAEMKERMEEVFNLSEAAQQVVSFAEPVRVTDGRPWLTEKFYQIMDNFGNNKELMDGVEDPDLATLAGVGYLDYAELTMSKSGDTWTVSGTDKRFGISPVSATNIMRTTFTGSSITASDNGTVGGVVFNADNGVSDGIDQPNGLIKFLLMWSIVMAGIRGLVTIFTSGFGGLIGGSAKAAAGMSTGLGQAIGGVVALVGGIFGISLMMSVAYGFIINIYDVLKDIITTLLTAVIAGPDALAQDIGDSVSGIPVIGGWLQRIFIDFVSVIMTFIAGFTLPKFGGVPITLFCQYLAEIPHRFAMEAQQIENKFTGDFRAGGMGGYGGAMSSASTLMNNAYNQAGNQLKQMGAGAATIAGAVGGFGLTKLGQKLEKSGSHSSDKSMASSSSDKETKAENTDPNSMDPNAMDPDVNPDAATPENTSPEGNPEGAENEGMDPQAQDAAEGGKDGDNNLSVSQDGDTTQGDEIEGKEISQEATSSEDSMASAQSDQDFESNTENQQDSDFRGDSQVDATDSMVSDQDSRDTTNADIDSTSDADSQEQTMNQQDTDSAYDSDQRMQSEAQEASEQAFEEQSMSDLQNEQAYMMQDDQLHETQAQAENLAEQQSMSDLRSEQNGQTFNENNTQTMNQSDQRSSQEHSAEAQAAHEQRMASQMRSDVRSSEKASSMAHTGSEHLAQSIHSGEHSQMNQSDSSVHSHASARSNSSHIAEKAVGGAAIAGALHHASQKANGRTGSVANPSAQHGGRNGKVGTMNPQRAKAPGTGTGSRSGSVNGQGRANPNAVRQGQAVAAGKNPPKGPGRDPVVTRQGQAMAPGSKNPPKDPVVTNRQGAPNKGDAVRSQRADRFKVAAGKALQAAGGHTDTSAMVGGIAAGAVHTAGSMMGAENVTQRAIVANREALARRRDIAQGRNPADRRRRQEDRQPKNNQQPNAGHTANDRRTVSQARYDERMAQEEAIRQAEREEAARRTPRE